MYRNILGFDDFYNYWVLLTVIDALPRQNVLHT